MRKIDLKRENKQTKPRSVVGLVCLFSFALLALLFAVLIVIEVEVGFVKDNRLLIIVLIIFAVSLLLLLGVVFALRGKIFLFRLTITLSFLFAFVSIIYYILQKSGLLAVFSDPTKYEEFLAGAGGWMAAIYVLLQFLQALLWFLD